MYSHNLNVNWLDQIFSKLPGKRKHLIPTINYDPMQYCLDHFDAIPDDADTVILCMRDIWALHGSNVLNHPKLANKKFFLADLGYENRKLAAQQWQIPTHLFYFLSKKKIQLHCKEPGLKHSYICLNNRAEFSRLVLGWRLWKADLLGDIIFSQSEKGAWWAQENGREPNLVSQLPDFYDYCRLLPIRTENDIKHEDIQLDWTVNHWGYQQSYCNIVTETSTSDDIYNPQGSSKLLEIVSEKSYKPFAAGQVPVFLACRGHIPCLQKQGFETMDQELFGPGFDSLTAHDKIIAIVDLVKKGPKFMENFYFEHLREIKHNHELFCSDRVDRLIMSNIDLFLQEQGLV